MLGLRYNPNSNLGLMYDLTYVDSFDNLRGSDSTLTTHSGRITYADAFFNKRVDVAATYDISSQTIDTISGQGESTVRLQLFPVHGLSGISDLTNPNQTPQMITLNENPAVIDGGLTASAGINLGLNSGLVTIPAAAEAGVEHWTRLRHVHAVKRVACLGGQGRDQDIGLI